MTSICVLSRDRRNDVKVVHHIPGSNILIDHWRPEKGKYRFMSLIRTNEDSIKYIKNDTYKIYTTPENQWLLQYYYDIPEDRVVALQINEPTIIGEGDESFQVTLFYSNYCLGSCMFLFQGLFGNILFTGYFRPSAYSNLFEVPVLKNLIENHDINTVYIDNTYAAETCKFPSRAETIKDLCTLIRAHPDHKVIISKCQFGKEEVLMTISTELNEKLCVSDSKYMFYSRMKAAHCFTTVSKKWRILVEDKILSLNECKERQKKYGKCLIILLTAMYQCSRKNSILRVPGLHIIPYSGHCNHDELISFLVQLQPRSIKPIIIDKRSPNYAIPECMFSLCYKSEDSVPVLDSDFDFLSYKEQLSIKNSDEVYESAINSPAENEMLLPKEKSVEKVWPPESVHSGAEDVFADSICDTSMMPNSRCQSLEKSTENAEHSECAYHDVLKNVNSSSDSSMSIQKVLRSVAKILEQISDREKFDEKSKKKYEGTDLNMSGMEIPDAAPCDENVQKTCDNCSNKSTLLVPDIGNPDQCLKENMDESGIQISDINCHKDFQRSITNFSDSIREVPDTADQGQLTRVVDALCAPASEVPKPLGEVNENHLIALNNVANKKKIFKNNSCTKEYLADKNQNYECLQCSSDVMIDSYGLVCRHSQSHQRSSALEREYEKSTVDRNLNDKLRDEHPPTKRAKLLKEEELNYMHRLLYPFTLKRKKEDWQLKEDEWKDLRGLPPDH